MSLSSYRQFYQALQTLLQQLQEGLQTDLKEDNPRSPSFQADLSQVQNLLGQELISLNLVNQQGGKGAKHQSIHTEINKQLRLLSTDALFLRTALQADTQQKRREQMNERLKLLLRYCQMGLEIEV